MRDVNADFGGPIRDLSKMALVNAATRAGLTHASIESVDAQDRPEASGQRAINKILVMHRESGSDVTYYVVGQNFNSPDPGVDTSDHCLAAIVDTSGDNRTFSVFEPNYGLVKFNDPAEAIDMMTQPDPNELLADSFDIVRVT